MRAIAAGILSIAALFSIAGTARADEADNRYLYVALPGIRDYLEYGGQGIVVFDIDHGHKFVKRIATAGLRPDGSADNVKGICASARRVGCMSVRQKRLHAWTL